MSLVQRQRQRINFESLASDRKSDVTSRRASFSNRAAPKNAIHFASTNFVSNSDADGLERIASATRASTSQNSDRGCNKRITATDRVRKGNRVKCHGFLNDWLMKNKDQAEDQKSENGLGVGEKTSPVKGGNQGQQRGEEQQRPQQQRESKKKKSKPLVQERSLRTHCMKANEKAKNAAYPEFGSNSDRSITNEQMKPDFGLRRDLHELYRVKDLDDEEPIGAGSYGIVRKVFERKTGDAFALKTLRKAPWAQVPSTLTAVEYYHSKLRNELECMRQLGASLNVVYLYDAFEDDDAVHLLMDLCEGGELLERISDDEYREADAARLIRAVLRTAAQCHSRGIVFRDIKPDNFLFKTNDENAPLKATDFGLAGKLPKNRDEPLVRRCGTPSYMAPEVINRKYGAEADVWSCGIVAYQLLTGRLPFRDVVNQRPNAKEVFRAILEDPLDLDTAPWDVISEEAKDFVDHLLERDPKKRPTARAALLHPWLQTNDAQWKSKQRRQVSGGVALGGQVVARLQRFATQGLLKRSVLRLLAGEIGKDLNELEKEKKEKSAIASDLKTKKKILVVNGPIKRSTLTGIDEKEFLELKQLFDRLDTSGDNLVELSELEVGLNKIGYDVTGKESEQLLAKLDTSGDGVVELNEFLAALVDWESVEKSESYPSWVKRAFNLLDEDNSGLLDANEVANFVVGDVADESDDEDSESVRRNALIRACIAEADGDGDGQIDVEEFASLLQMDPSDGLDQYDWRFNLGGGSYDDSKDEADDMEYETTGDKQQQSTEIKIEV